MSTLAPELFLRKARNAHARLLAALERAVEVDAVASPDVFEARLLQVRRLTAACEEQGASLLRLIGRRPEGRAARGAEPAAQVDQFVALLKRDLESLKERVALRAGALRDQQRALQEELGKILQQRQALRRYRRKGPRSAILDKKA